MAVAVDLSKHTDCVEFVGSSEEDINYAKTFWQSVQLEPPAESRLVSSDIKQRLKVAPSGTHGLTYAHNIPEEKPELHDFFVRVRTLEQLEHFSRVQKFAEAREEDRTMIEKRRAERIKRESISRDFIGRKREVREAYVDKSEEADNGVIDEDPSDALLQLDAFEKSKFGEQDPDSD
ncbi:UPF0722 protein-like [Mizuhopecten yessoensis]|uniref:Cilia- and flagella-associated protein HOATZ n=1 Tax=Mizuhopecten yessoensis TaxID=6573 RepID=A0A210QL60_MIZYE|nr:UPF0722 protein-like [Mizuhopecten yessoensis]OWF49479.1 UPF0722 protein [Mizuhopecten yessoensis]